MNGSKQLAGAVLTAVQVYIVGSFFVLFVPLNIPVIYCFTLFLNVYFLLNFVAQRTKHFFVVLASLFQQLRVVAFIFQRYRNCLTRSVFCRYLMSHNGRIFQLLVMASDVVNYHE